MNSRNYQNILHIVGIINTVFTAAGGVIIGRGDTWTGIIMMMIGGSFLRISSEVEFRKMNKLMDEHQK